MRLILATFTGFVLSVATAAAYRSRCGSEPGGGCKGIEINGVWSRDMTITACRGDDVWGLSEYCGEKFGGMGSHGPYSLQGHAYAIDLVARSLSSLVGSSVFEKTAATGAALFDAAYVGIGAGLRIGRQGDTTSRALRMTPTATTVLESYRRLYLDTALAGKGKYLVASTYGGLGNRHIQAVVSINSTPLFSTLELITKQNNVACFQGVPTNRYSDQKSSRPSLDTSR